MTIVIIISTCIVIFFLLTMPSSSPKPNSDFNYDHKMQEFNFNISRGIFKKKMEIKNIELDIELLNIDIQANEKIINNLKELYPDGEQFIRPILRPEHYNIVEMCDDKEVNANYIEVLKKKHNLEDTIYLQKHIIQSYEKYRIRKQTYKDLP